MEYPTVETRATVPIMIGQRWRMSLLVAEDKGVQDRWEVIAVGPEFCLMQNKNCESHFVTKIVNIRMWQTYFPELIKDVR